MTCRALTLLVLLAPLAGQANSWPQWRGPDASGHVQGTGFPTEWSETKKPFKNFEFKAEVMTLPHANAGIYFHTKYQDAGWPKAGFECQVNNTYHDPKKTASIYGVKDTLEAPANDDEWFEVYIKVEGKKVVTKVNGKTIVEWTQPDDWKAGDGFERILGEGTFALQGHDPGSTVLFRNLRVKRLP